MFFDINRLFTNVPFDETIEIWADVSFATDNKTNILLMEAGNGSVEFSFNNASLMGVTKSSPLDHFLADIFVGFQEISTIPL